MRYPLYILSALTFASAASAQVGGLVQVQKTPVVIQRGVGFECADLVDSRDPTRTVTAQEARELARRRYGTEVLRADPNAPDPSKVFKPDPSEDVRGALALGQDPRPPGSDATSLPPEPGLTPPPLTVQYVSIESGLSNASQQLLTLKVTGDSRHPGEWTIIAGLKANEAMARRKLMEGLGYRFVPAQLWPKLTIRFGANQIADRDRFIARLETLSGSSRNLWVDGELTPTSQDVTLRNMVLTVAGTSLSQLEWAIAQDFADIERAPERFTNSNCNYRELIVPWVLMDWSDFKINSLDWRVGSIQGDSVVFMHRYGKLFRNTTWSEVRRIGMAIGAKPAEFWNDVIAAAKLPEPVARLLLEKTKARRNDLVRLLDLGREDIEGQPLEHPVDWKLTVASSDPQAPHVKDGKLLSDVFPGWPHSFRAPDNGSPLNAPEIFRYIGIEAVAALAEYGSQKLTESFLSRTVEEGAQAHAQKIQRELIQAIIEGRQFVQRIGEPWFAPVFDGGVSAFRRVVSGSFYGGSVQAAQQVDSFTLQGGAGVFMGLDNIPHLPVGTMFQVRYARSYLHQRPLLSADLKINLEAIKNDKRPIFGPYWFGKLGAIVKAESSDVTEPERDPQDPDRLVWKDSLQKFYDLFIQGEALTIADTFIGGAQSMIPIQDLIQTKILGSLFGISPQASAQQAIIKKTRIERTKVTDSAGRERDGLRIDISSLPPRSFEVGVGVSWFASLLKLSTGWQGGEGIAQSYFIADPQTKADRQYLAARLYRILYFNSTDLLTGTDTEVRDRKIKFTPHRLQAKVSSTKTSIDTLYHQRFRTKAVQVLKYHPPAPTADEITADPSADFDPSKRELNFWVHTDRLEEGNNFTSFLLSLIPKFPLGSASENPANNFLGATKGTTVTTEVEFTRNREALPQTSVETHLRGNRISKNDLLEVLHEAARRLGPIGEQFRLRQESTAEFANTDTVFLYAASEVLNLKYDGLKKLRQVLKIPAEGSASQADDPGQVLRNLLEIEGSVRGVAPPARTGLRSRLFELFGLGETQPPEPGSASFAIRHGDEAYQAGLARLGAWCERYAERWPSNAPLFQVLENKSWGPTEITRHQNSHRRGKTLIVDGRLWQFRCLKPWMWNLLDARGRYLSLRAKKPWDLFKWYSQVAAIINDPEALPQFLAWLGEENFAYQIRVTGFRKGSEQKGPTDIGLQDYESSTIGAAIPELQGTIQSLIQEKRISADTVMSLFGGLSGTRN